MAIATGPRLALRHQSGDLSADRHPTMPAVARKPLCAPPSAQSGPDTGLLGDGHES